MGKDTKENILNTAFRLFVDNSYEGVTVDEIAEEASVSKGAVFHYYDSKFELANKSIFYYMENNWMPIYEDILKSEEPNVVAPTLKLKTINRNKNRQRI